MYRVLNQQERFWLEKILCVEFKGRQIIIEQLSDAKILAEYGYDYISLKFKIKTGKKYPYPVRVPVEMRAFQKQSAPIVFLLHIVNGFVDELELVTADSSRICQSMIGLEVVEYVINENVKK